VLGYLARLTGWQEWPLFFTVIGIAVTLIIAAASFRLVEEPLRDAVKQMVATKRRA